MKSIARNYVYWPGLDADIEQLCRSCEACRQQRDAPPHAPLTPWQFPSRPWQRLHADFAECRGKHYLIIVDAHSKWIEVFQMNSTTARLVIDVLRELFARFGLPLQFCSDNGPPFNSQEIKNYFDKNAIVQSLISPYRPQGNGAAENAVRTVKNCIKKAYVEGTDITQAISKMLFQYRNCEHATTGVAPSVALLGRRLRGRLDALRPSVEERVRDKQRQQVERAGGTPRQAHPGDTVYVRGFSKNKDKWVEGQIRDRVGPNSFSVNLPNNVVKRHIDQILVPKPVQKRFSLSCTSSNVFSDDKEISHVNNQLKVGSDATGGVVSSTPKTGSVRDARPSSATSPPPSAPVQLEIDNDNFEMARSSPAPASNDAYNTRLRPRRNRPLKK